MDQVLLVPRRGAVGWITPNNRKNYEEGVYDESKTITFVVTLC